MTGGLRVALLSPVHWPEVRRGTERFVRDLADGLIARGHAPTLITSHPRGLLGRAVEDGLAVIRVPRPFESRMQRRMYEEHLAHLPFAWLALRSGRFDLAHAVHPSSGLLAARFRARTGRPAVLSYMGVPHRSWIAGRRRRADLTLEAFRGASATVVLSRAAAAACEHWLGVVPDAVIPPGVNLAAFAPGGSRAAAPTIVCPAAVDVERKRVRLLVEAFGLLRRSRPDARLVLSQSAGAPPAWCRAPGVELADLDTRERLVGAYRSAWLCALVSRGEAFGLVLAEALACGTPVLGSDEGAIPELLDDPAVGVLYAGEDVAALAVALERGLELPLRGGTAAACRARVQRLSVDQMTDRYLNLYEQLGDQ